MFKWHLCSSYFDLPCINLKCLIDGILKIRNLGWRDHPCQHSPDKILSKCPVYPSPVTNQVTVVSDVDLSRVAIYPLKEDDEEQLWSKEIGDETSQDTRHTREPHTLEGRSGNMAVPQQASQTLSNFNQRPRIPPVSLSRLPVLVKDHWVPGYQNIEHRAQGQSLSSLGKACFSHFHQAVCAQ